VTLQRILRIISVIVFLAVGVGFGSFHAGTVELDLLGLGLACFAASLV